MMMLTSKIVMVITEHLYHEQLVNDYNSVIFSDDDDGNE